MRKKGEYMFTGIIEETGTVAGITGNGQESRLCICCRKVLQHTKTGDSIAVNGVCLTAVHISEHQFEADVMEETLSRSSLARARAGTKVNLERAMAADGRFGGHMVSGHIDGTGTIQKITPRANAVWFTVQAPGGILRYIVEKGSVALDGVSLTVAAVNQREFAVSVIPHTIQETILSDKKPGELVNIECDVVGKYVEKLLGLEPPERLETGNRGITEEFLRSYGF